MAPADPQAEARSSSAVQWIDARWAEPLDASGTVWDVWLEPRAAWSPAALPLGGAVAVQTGSLSPTTSVPVAGLFDLASPTETTNIPASNPNSLLRNDPYDVYSPLGSVPTGALGDRSQIAGTGAISLGLATDTVHVSTATVTPFGDQGPDWFEYWFILGRYPRVDGDQLYANSNEPTAECRRWRQSDWTVARCSGSFRSGFHWYHDGSFANLVVWAWAIPPSRLAVSADVPPNGLGLGERVTIDVALEDVEVEPSGDTPVTVWLDPRAAGSFGPTYGDVVNTQTGARGDTLTFTLDEVLAGAAAYEVQSEPAQFGTSVPVRVEPDFEAPDAPTPGSVLVSVHGVEIDVEVSTTTPSTGQEVVVSGSVADWPSADPATPGSVFLYTAFSRDTDLDVQLTNLRTGAVASGSVDDRVALPITLGDLLNGEVSVSLTGTVADPGQDFFRVTTLFGEAYGDSDNVFIQPGLELTVAPDTLRAGEEALFTVEAAGLDPATPVTFSVPDLTVGGFVIDGGGAARTASGIAGGASDGSRQASVTRALSAVGDVRFLAAETAPDSAVTVMVSVEAGGRSGETGLTVLPNTIAVRLLHQNGYEVPALGDSAYVMVSKVRPDWLLPEFNISFDSTGYEARTEYPILGYWRSTEPTTLFDPHTYRAEVEGLPEGTDPGRVRFLLDLSGTPILTDGREDGDKQNFAEYEAVCESQSDTTLTCRSKRFLRFVSNARPSRGALGTYDDQIADLQTLRVRLGDRVRVFAAVLDEGGASQVQGQPVIYPVGASAGVDAVREGHLVWRTYQGESSEPTLMTERASEDWTQASIKFRSETGLVFGRASAQNVAQVSFQSGSNTAQGAGSFAVYLTTPGGPCEAVHTFAAGIPLVSAASALVSDAVAKCTTLTDSSVEAYARDRSRVRSPANLVDAVEFWTVFGRDGEVVVDSVRVTGEGKHEPNVRIDLKATESDGSEAVFAAAAAFHDGRRETIDVIVVPHRSITQARNPGTSPLADVGTQAFATWDGETTLPPNVVITRSRLVDEKDDLPTGLGHEISHVLLVGAFEGGGGVLADGTTTVSSSHHESTLNLLYPLLNSSSPTTYPPIFFREGVEAPKRLSRAQQVAARCESGPVSDHSTLTCPATDSPDTTNPPILQPPSTGARRSQDVTVSAIPSTIR